VSTAAVKKMPSLTMLHVMNISPYGVELTWYLFSMAAVIKMASAARKKILHATQPGRSWQDARLRLVCTRDGQAARRCDGQVRSSTDCTRGSQATRHSPCSDVQ